MGMAPDENGPSRGRQVVTEECTRKDVIGGHLGVVP